MDNRNFSGKQEILQELTVFNDKIKLIENNFTIDLSELSNKIRLASKSIQDEVFSIAFFGAFSDGKSTILSALTARLDIDIAPEPTTDKVIGYTFDDYQIVDTPGLFSENLIHDELTKKYISEANIIVYTVDPVNPLKDTHESTIKWILSDLGKYDATIFVVNKMDEVADLEDDNDFALHSGIKTDVVSGEIDKAIGKTEDKKIICVAADPFEQGLEYWHSNQEDYAKLSRMTSLDNMISKFKDNYKNELIVKAGISVIIEAKINLIHELDRIKEVLVEEVIVLNNQIDEYQTRLNVLDNDINRAYINIKEDFISLRENILVELDTVSNMTELGETIQKLLGKEGYILQEGIDLIIRKYTGSLLSESKNLFVSLEESLVYHSNIQDNLIKGLTGTGKTFIKGVLSAPTRKLADATLKARNLLKIPFKFKPWGAMKFAKFLKAMPVVMEALEFALGAWNKYKMDKKRNEIKNEIENAFKGLFKELTPENYTKTYFPYFVETNKVLLSIESSKSDIDGSISQIKQITYELGDV